MRQLSPARRRQRKLLLMLPLLVTPFISIAFWALGGGRSPALLHSNRADQEGLNLDLPGAQFKGEKELTKLGYYEKAASDSSKLRAAIKNDPYYDGSLSFAEENESFEEEMELPADNKILKRPLSPPSSADQESKLYEKIQALQQAMNDAGEIKPSSAGRYQPDYNLPTASPQLQRLEQLLQQPRDKADSDPELDQLSSMLDKIKDIQHPELVKTKPPATSSTEEVTPLLVSETPQSDTIADGFYPLSFSSSPLGSTGVRAAIHEATTVVNGSVVRLRLLQDLFIGTIRIPAGTFIHGTASLQRERLQVLITQLLFENELYPVQLVAHDLDGLPGLYIPGTGLQDIPSTAASNSTSSLGMLSLDPSLAAQATTAGINTVKSLLTRKVKVVRVHLKANYQIHLHNKNSKR